eukprot:TRINITY_DN6018_c0_g1_i1.p1 TRINITY_DN6018_c0_g1~~TRINITY_DN6018_c0_g1_i1.p1  ORF type:complete len:281 (-),score=13.67 TRINITY_DN6018_c0_g1_i1:193-1035(-)
MSGTTCPTTSASREPTRYGTEPLPPPRHMHMRLGCGHRQKLRDCSHIHTLKYELARSYYWSGFFWQDYWYFVMNWHPLLSIFFCHPDHPWKKCQKFFMLVIQISITELPLLSLAVYNRARPVDHDLLLVEYLREHNEKLLIFLGVTIPNIFLGVLLNQCAVGGTRCPCCLQFFRCFTKFLIMICLWFSCVLAVFAMLLTLGKEDLAMENFFRRIAQSQLQYHAVWFPVCFLMPCHLGFYSGWSASRRKLQLDPEFTPTKGDLEKMPWATDDELISPRSSW